MYNLDEFDKVSEKEQLLLLEQVGMEHMFHSDATKKYEHSVARMVSAGIFSNTSEGSVLQKMAIEQVSATIEDWAENGKERGLAGTYRTFIRESFHGRYDVLAFTVLEILLNKTATKLCKLSRLSIQLTKEILNLLSIEDFKRRESKLYKYLEYEYRSRGIGYINSRKRKLASMKGCDVADMDASVKEETFKMQIGSRLIDCVVKSGCGLFEIRADYHAKKSIKSLQLTDDVFKIMGRVKDKNILFSVQYKPLVAPPLPWSSLWGNGGYYSNNPLTFIRNIRAQRYIEESGEPLNIDRLFTTINHIQETKWHVNNFILGVVDTIIAESLVDPSTPKGNPGYYGKIPYMDTLNVYEMVKKEDFGPLDSTGRHVELADYRVWFKAKEVQLKKLEAMRSKRIMFLLAHSIATEYKDRDQMYFTYNTDFRGRLYPIQQILNPQSTGSVKAFLEFAEPHVLDERGQYWLKIHIANCYGYDKKSYQDRIAWVDSMSDELVAYATTPLDYLKEWNDADSPLMFLASCDAYASMLRGEGVQLPVSLDATCSGLQLYAGLLKDREGASVVNVVDKGTGYDAEPPADVYTDVAELVESKLQAGEYPTKLGFHDSTGEFRLVDARPAARDLMGNVDRKLTKRNVMTIPYSVTQRGMFDQIREILDEMRDNDKVFWKADKWVVEKLLVELNKSSIATIVPSAIIGQEYIKSVVTQYYSERSASDPIYWRTPFFNFPVVQWKVETVKKEIRTVLGRLSIRKSKNVVNKRQQKNGIAPNLIHSLDATLMYLTVEKLKMQGVTDFMLIHDSFGVPANSVENLTLAVRQSFIELFEADPLFDWVNQITPEIVESTGDIMLNTLDLGEVMQSTYIFS
jgi:DNA-directed RNA polymerase